MTIIGTEEEIMAIKKQCDGRCVNGEWCIFAVQDDCPVDDYGCMAIGYVTDKNGQTFSVLNER